MALSIASFIADLEAAVHDVQKALPALEALLTVADKIKPLLPAADQVIVTEIETAVNTLISALSKV